MSSPAIDLEGLTKHYGATIGVEDVDLEVRQGEVFGFLGPNGAGKTTCIRVLLDLIRPTRGSARVLGLDCQEASEQVRGQIGYLPGELELWPELTGRGILGHLSKLRGSLTSLEDGLEIADRLDADLDKRSRDLSTGNKQKIGIAAAFMARPSVLILDEPTSGLDPLMQRTVHELVDEARADGRTVFFSSHILHEVERVADRVGIIRGGRVVAVEDVEDLIHQGIRRVEVVFRGEPRPGAFEALDGVEEVEVDGARLSCRVSGSMDAFVKELARHEVVDVRSQDPDLEETFLRFYGGLDRGA